MWAKLFPSKSKTPHDVVKSLRESITQISSSSAAGKKTDEAAAKKLNDELTKSMHALKVVLFGDPSNDVAVKDHEVLDVIRLACDTDFLFLIVSNLSIMEFETRKDAVQIFNNLLRHSSNTKALASISTPSSASSKSSSANSPTNAEASLSSPNSSTSTAITSNMAPLDDAAGIDQGSSDASQDNSAGATGDKQNDSGDKSTSGNTAPKSVVLKVAENDGEILRTLMKGYDDGDIALNCGHIIRECVKYELLMRLLFTSGAFWKLFKLIELDDFDIASDAFQTFKDCFVRHLNISAKFIEGNLKTFNAEYNQLLSSSNYVTRRQSLKLLGELLLERSYFKIMTHYISQPVNLRTIMNLLLDNRKNIQFEAFHVFKIFVANPKKPVEIQLILARNKDKMLNYLQDFLSDREDEQFQEDRRSVRDEIQRLRIPNVEGSSS